jgi:hypothetical protein
VTCRKIAVAGEAGTEGLTQVQHLHTVVTHVNGKRALTAAVGAIALVTAASAAAVQTAARTGSRRRSATT